MFIYKGYKCVYLGLKRWRISTPNSVFDFDLIMRGGIPELKERINLWRCIIDDDYRA